MTDRRRLSIFAAIYLACVCLAPVDATAAPRDDFTNRKGDEIGALSELVRHLQQMLGKMGFYTGEADGRMNERLRDSIEAYQRATGRNPDGKVSKQLAEHMETQDKVGTVIPVEITVYEDRSFTFILKTPPASVLLVQAAGIAKGSGKPNAEKVGTVTRAQGRENATIKLPDLNATEVEPAMRIIEGTAKNMGITVVE